MISEAVSLQVHAHSVSAVVFIIEAPEKVMQSDSYIHFSMKVSKFSRMPDSHPDIPA